MTKRIVVASVLLLLATATSFAAMKVWEVSFKCGEPNDIKAYDPGFGARSYTYLVYEITNPTDEEITITPDVSIATDVNNPGETTVLSLVERLRRDDPEPADTNRASYRSLANMFLRKINAGRSDDDTLSAKKLDKIVLQVNALLKLRANVVIAGLTNEYIMGFDPKVPPRSVLRFEDKVLPTVHRTIEQKLRHRYLTSIQISNALKPQESKKAVATFDQIDLRADQLTVVAAGLTNEYKTLNLEGEDVALRRVFILRYARPGDKFHRPYDLVELASGSESWIWQCRIDLVP